MTTRKTITFDEIPLDIIQSQDLVITEKGITSYPTKDNNVYYHVDKDHKFRIEEDHESIMLYNSKMVVTIMKNKPSLSIITIF